MFFSYYVYTHSSKTVFLAKRGLKYVYSSKSQGWMLGWLQYFFLYTSYVQENNERCHFEMKNHNVITYFMHDVSDVAEKMLTKKMKIVHYDEEINL